MKLTSELLRAADICHQPIILSEGFSYGTICDELPYSYLLKKNAVFDMLKTNDPIYVSHQTKYHEDISASGLVRRGGGCLGSVLYTTPLYGKEGDVRDNFFSLVLSHQLQSQKESMSELIVIVPNRLKGIIYGMNYLRAGILLSRVAAQLGVVKEEVRIHTKAHAEALVVSSEYQQLLKSEDIKTAYGAIHTLATQEPFFAHLYYEALSQVVLLSSRDEVTEELARKGEFNARSFYDLLFAYGIPEGDRYDTSRFSPDYKDAQRILRYMNEGGKTKLSIEDTLSATLCNIRESIVLLGDKDSQVAQIEGQLYLSNLKGEALERLLAAFSGVVQEYRSQYNIDIVINSATLKQELGVSTALATFATRESHSGRMVSRPYVLEDAKS